MLFLDRLTIDKARVSSEGYMAIHAKAARSGIYQYLGREVDPSGSRFKADAMVNVYRPPEEVFDKASLSSFVSKPITNDHPTEAVTSANWRDLAHGMIMGAVPDGEYVGFDLAFMDAGIIADLDSGKSELSNGYDCNLVFEDGELADGTKYQAVQRRIRGNHVALVDAGRAGSECRVGDSVSCEPIPSDAARKLLVDQRTYTNARDGVINTNNDAPNGDTPVPKLITVDGLQIDISNVDVAEATINNLRDRLLAETALKDKALGEVAGLTAEKVTTDAKVTTLETQLADAKITPAMLRDAAKSFADTAAKAKALGITVTDEMDDAAIRKATVAGKLGDKAKDYTEDQINIAFDTLTIDVKAADQQPDAMRDAIASGIRQVGSGQGTQAIADARQARLNRLETAHLGGEPN